MVARVDSRITRSSPRSNPCRSRTNDFPAAYLRFPEISLGFLTKTIVQRKEGFVVLEFDYSFKSIRFRFGQIDSVRLEFLNFVPVRNF